MKVIFLIIFGCLVSSATAFGQAVGEKKYPIAIVTTWMFLDEKDGVKKLAKAYIAFESTDCAASFEFAHAQSKLKAINDEIAVLKSQNKPYKSQSDERIRLEDLSRRKLKQNADCKAAWRRSTVESVEKEVYVLLDRFARLRGYTMVVDSDKVFGGTILDTKEVDDITIDFIKYCNEVFKKEVEKRSTK